MQETTQRIIKLLGLLLPDLLVKKRSYQTSLHVLENQIDCKACTTAKGQNLLAHISTSRASSGPALPLKKTSFASWNIGQ